MLRNAPAGRRGMTLVEVLIALVLLSIGIAGTLDLLFNLTQSVASARRQTQAAGLLEAHLARLQSAGYAALDEQIRKLAKPPDAAAATLSLGNSLNPTFNANLRREQAGGARCIAITVAANWRERGGARGRKAVGYVFAP